MARKNFTRKQRKPPKPRNGDEYEQWQAAWERRRNDPDHGAANWLVEPADLDVGPTDLMKTLSVLRTITQDRAFDAARAAVVAHNLVDSKTGQWRRPAVLAHEPVREVCEAIESAIAAGVSERAAIAEATFEFNIRAASFRAAHQRVYRLLREYRNRSTRPAQKMKNAKRN